MQNLEKKVQEVDSSIEEEERQGKEEIKKIEMYRSIVKRKRKTRELKEWKKQFEGSHYAK